MFFEDTEVSRYKYYRELGKDLHEQLLQHIGRIKIQKAGKEIGLAQGKFMVFENTDQMAVLQDYCIHTYRVGMKSIFDIFIEKSQSNLGSEEMALLNALKQSFFSVFKVKGTEKSFYCHMINIFNQAELTVIDSGLGRTAFPGLMLVGRLIQIPGSLFYMSTGSSIPIMHQAALREIEHIMLTFSSATNGAGLSRTQEASFAKQAIRMLLRFDTSHGEHVEVLGSPLK
ncbi:MAG: hypothetical protein H7832_12145 [Magnetococcus sp. DMHC-6]